MTNLFLIAICGNRTIAYTLECDHLDAIRREDRIIAAFDVYASKADGECVGVELSYSSEGHKRRGIKMKESNGKFSFKR